MNKADDAFDVVRIVCKWRLRSQDTDGTYCVLEVAVPPMCVVPLHQHSEQEAFFMLEGNVDFAESKDGVPHWRTLGAGEMINIPSDALHGFRNLSGQAAKCLLTTQARMESFFLEVGIPVPSEPTAPSEAEIQRLMTIANKHGHRFLPPEAAT